LSFPSRIVPAAASSPILAFAVRDGGVLEHAAVPTLRFALNVRSEGGEEVRSVALNVQLRVAATRRAYDVGAQARLAEIFGRPEQWDRSLRSLHWTDLTVNVGPFTGETEVELPVTCTYDFEVAIAKYLSALEDGDVPLEFLFSGTVFYPDQDGRLQVSRIGWDSEAEFRLPASAWREMMDRHFPDSAWLRLRRESFDRLYAYRASRTLTTWEETVDSLLRAAGET
jgi:Family of unknown function (DUF6084)